MTPTPHNLTPLHHALGLCLLKSKTKSRLKRADNLVKAMRHMLCAWILDEATPDQLLKIVDGNKTSPKN